MSFAIAPLAVFQDRRLTLTDVRTLLALLSFTTPQRLTCWPSRRTLAERIGVSSLARISETLGRLQRLGWVSILHREGSSLYTITPPDLTPPPLPPVTPPPLPPVDMEEAIGQTNLPPSPPEGDVVVGVLSEEHDIGDQDIGDQQDITEDQAAVIIAWMNTVTGSKLDPKAKPLQRLVGRRLRTYSQAQLQIVISFYSSLWRGTAMEQHARNPRCVLSPTRIEFAIAEHARMGEQDKAQSSRIWKPEPDKPRDKDKAKGALAGLRAILHC